MLTIGEAHDPDPGGRARAWSIGWPLAALAAAALGLAAAGLLVMDAPAGLDLTDEGLYLLAADNHQPTAAANGWFGAYTGLLFAAVGHDIALFRVAGLAVLLACGLLLGTGLLQVLKTEGVSTNRSASVAIVLGVTAGQLAFYGLYLRTPAYNWLALTGALLAAAGMLRQLAAPPMPTARSVLLAGLLVGAGCSLALWGKTSAGIGLLVLELVVAGFPAGSNRRARARVGLVAAIAAAALLALHAVFVADPATTIAVIRRSLGWLAVVDPRYGPLAAVRQAIGDVTRLPWSAVLATTGVVALSVSPIVLLARRGRWGPLPAVLLGMAAIAGVGLTLLLEAQWVGGTGASARLGIAHVTVLASASLVALTSWVVARARWNEDVPSPWRLLGAAGILVGAAAFYAFGSNNGLITQMHGAGGLVLLAAALLAVSAVPRRWGSRVLVGFSLSIATIALVIVGTARLDPYRTAPIDDASVRIEYGQRGVPLEVDHASATFWRTLQATAHVEGWQPGDRLLDLTWSPAVAYALGATVPETLAANFSRQNTATASAIEALRLSGGPAWRDAWVLVSPAFSGSRPTEILATVGRRFPDDYRLVLRLTAPWRDLPLELWQPVTP